MKNIKWHYPKTLSEATALIQHTNAVIHSGGTALIDRKLSENANMIDLYHLGLNKINFHDDQFEADAMCSYQQLVKALKDKAPDSLLLKSLRYSANTPLRNRITLGGSIAFFPPWSDLMGPLIALQAKISLVGAAEGLFPIEEYATSRTLRQGTLIKCVTWSEADILGDHYRETRTRSDMPLFTITVAIKGQSNKVSSAKIIVVGVHDKYTELTDLENWLSGKSESDINENDISSQIKLRFGGHRINDSDYMAEKAAIQTERLILKLLKEI